MNVTLCGLSKLMTPSSLLTGILLISSVSSLAEGDVLLETPPSPTPTAEVTPTPLPSESPKASPCDESRYLFEVRHRWNDENYGVVAGCDLNKNLEVDSSEITYEADLVHVKSGKRADWVFSHDEGKLPVFDPAQKKLEKAISDFNGLSSKKEP